VKDRLCRYEVIRILDIISPTDEASLEVTTLPQLHLPQRANKKHRPEPMLYRTKRFCNQYWFERCKHNPNHTITLWLIDTSSENTQTIRRSRHHSQSEHHQQSGIICQRQTSLKKALALASAFFMAPLVGLEPTTCGLTVNEKVFPLTF